jgi:hypothetical protein
VGAGAARRTVGGHAVSAQQQTQNKPRRPRPVDDAAEQARRALQMSLDTRQ